MKVNIEGRIANIRLGERRSLYPLFEAIVNSIHSVISQQAKNGYVKIIVERDCSQSSIFENSSDSQSILNFTIEDNGVGFDERNFESFCTSDTKYKIGAKGIGRFMWLKAFDKVKIESVFGSNGNSQKRTFDFLVTPKGIENPKLNSYEGQERKTCVRLISLKPKYQKHCPKNLQTIGERIVEHCLIHFLSDYCPTISIEDDSSNIVLNKLFSKTIKDKIQENSFVIKGKKFDVINLQLYFSEERKHQAHFCAHERVVRSIDLSKRILDLTTKLKDDNDDSFLYTSYVSSPYLDDNVTPERIDFYIEKESDSLLPNLVSFDEIENETVSIAKTYLRDYLKPISENKKKEYIEFIQTKAPQYRSISKFMPEFLDSIPPNLSDEKLDIELHKIKAKKTVELKEKTQDLINQKVESIKDATTFIDEYNKILPEISGISADQLAEYVLYRKSIISLLEKSLGLNDIGKYHREEAIHKIIYPMRTTSNDVDYDQQNLWLIDERLSYHYFLASDKPFNKTEVVEMESRERPDILVFNDVQAVFNNALAYAEDKAPISSVVIIEFKRPVREDYSEEENPFRQVTSYISQMRDSKVKDRNGRYIEITNNVPFYAYIICDLTPKLKTIATNDFDYTQTPDGLGYFTFNKNLNSYIEVISYTKLLEDSKKRNAVLFDKLNLPK